MAYHAGAELTGIECFQINPLIKDYNGPACAYVTGPVRRLHRQRRGRPLHRVRLLERPDDAGVLPRAAVGNGPVFLKLDHLRRGNHHRDREHPAHATSGRAAGASTQGRGTDYRTSMVEMHISEIGLCSGHSASGVWVNDGARPRSRACTRPVTWRACRTTTCWAPWSTASSAARTPRTMSPGIERHASSRTRCEAERNASLRRCRAPNGLPPLQFEYKTAPAGQRLPAAAQGHAQDGDRPAALRARSARTWRDRRTTRTS